MAKEKKGATTQAGPVEMEPGNRTGPIIKEPGSGREGPIDKEPGRDAPITKEPGRASKIK